MKWGIEEWEMERVGEGENNDYLLTTNHYLLTTNHYPICARVDKPK
jgi:hypothetical protein